MKTHFPLRLFGLVLIILTGCDNTPIEPVLSESEAPVSWQLHPEITLDLKLQMQATVAGDSLWLLGNNYLLCLDANHRLVYQELVAPLGNNLWRRSFLSEEIFATELHQQVEFDLQLNRDPDKKVHLDLRGLDSTVSSISSAYHSPMAINASGEILIPALNDLNLTPNTTGFPLFLLSTSMHSHSLQIDNSERIWLNNGSLSFAGVNNVSGVCAFGDTFYFSIQSPPALYQYVPGQSPTNLFPLRLANLMMLGDTLTAIGYLSDFNLGWYYRPPGTAGWVGFDLGVFDNGFARYEPVDNRVVAYRQKQLWEIAPSADFQQREFRELDRTGLDLLTIHDLVVFKDRVYLCTSTGLYYKHISDFFTLQETP